MNYYLIPIHKLTSEDTVSSIETIQNVSHVTNLLPDDLSQIWKIPAIQSYNGYAIVITSNIIFTKYLDINNYITSDDAIVYSDDKNIFIINCSHSIFKDKINPIKPLHKYMSFDFTDDNIFKINNELKKYFNYESEIVDHDKLL